MPFERLTAAPRRIAVIGGGISGMAAAYMLDDAAMERDAGKRKAMYTDMQAEFRKTSPFVMLFQQTEVAAMRANVDGLRLGPTSDSTYLFKVSKK